MPFFLLVLSDTRRNRPSALPSVLMTSSRTAIGYPTEIPCSDQVVSSVLCMILKTPSLRFSASLRSPGNAPR